MDSIFATLWAPEIRLWFLSGAVVSFAAGFFSMSHGSAFKKIWGLLVLSLLFFAALGILILLWLRSSFVLALIVFILYWMCLRIGGRMMMLIAGPLPEGSDMRTDMGFFDRLFGKKVTIQLPGPDGSVREVTVTARWVEEMERLGKMTPVAGQTVKVHILDPQAGLGGTLGLSEDEIEEFGMSTAVQTYRVEEWTIGERISAEQYRAFRDPGTRDVYVLLVYEAGKPTTHLVRKEIWNQARAAIENV